MDHAGGSAAGGRSGIAERPDEDHVSNDARLRRADTKI